MGSKNTLRWAPRQRSLMSIYRETLECVFGQGGKVCVHMHAHRTQTVVMCRYAHTCARVRADIPNTPHTVWPLHTHPNKFRLQRLQTVHHTINITTQ